MDIRRIISGRIRIFGGSDLFYTATGATRV